MSRRTRLNRKERLEVISEIVTEGVCWAMFYVFIAVIPSVILLFTASISFVGLLKILGVLGCVGFILGAVRNIIFWDL